MHVTVVYRTCKINASYMYNVVANCIVIHYNKLQFFVLACIVFRIHYLYMHGHYSFMPFMKNGGYVAKAICTILYTL